jgi:predicted PolB exonuclease-like 3'-5' exonuclease
MVTSKMEKYPEAIREFVKVRFEQTPNNTQIARDVQNKFGIVEPLERTRVSISRFRSYLGIEAKRRGIKRLFFDGENSYYTLMIRAWQLKNFQRYFDYRDIVKEREVICISYKWQGDDQVHTLDWRNGEKRMLKEFVDIMGEADECVAHNGDRFDIPTFRTRCLHHGVLMYPNYRTFDTLKKARSKFMFASNKLDYLGKFMGIGGKEEHDGFQLWRDVVEGDQPSMNDIYKAAKGFDTFEGFIRWHEQNWGIDVRLDEMIRYCERDVVLLEDVFFVLSPFIDHNNNFAVLTGGKKWECPECTSKRVRMFRTYTTPMGVVRREMKCDDCKKQYRVSNKTYMAMLETLHNDKI